ncbi:hypothetical protein BD779DRAFT_1476638 [Infundibulicybe gibba]|nr:hypothetical protein BD779DRAFT_1476638 [Infundibulicybe gibba]
MASILMKRKPQPSSNPSRKRLRVFMDAVVITTTPKSLGMDANAKNPKVKKGKKEEPNLGPDILQGRLQHTGLQVYPTILERTIRDTAVPRNFIWYHHGSHQTYLNQDHQPFAPAIPGSPGIFFGVGHKSSDVGQEVQRIFTRIARGHWLYMGQYQLQRDRPLTKEEWASIGLKVQNTWTSSLSTAAWGKRVRLRIALRKRLGRQPTSDEIQEELGRSGRRSLETTREDLSQAFLRGEETISVWVMKCVGYDAEFQRALVDKLPSWTTRRRGTTYMHRGTRSRPVRQE